MSWSAYIWGRATATRGRSEIVSRTRWWKPKNHWLTHICQERVAVASVCVGSIRRVRSLQQSFDQHRHVWVHIPRASRICRWTIIRSSILRVRADVQVCQNNENALHSSSLSRFKCICTSSWCSVWPWNWHGFGVVKQPYCSQSLSNSILKTWGSLELFTKCCTLQ